MKNFWKMIIVMVVFSLFLMTSGGFAFMDINNPVYNDHPVDQTVSNIGNSPVDINNRNTNTNINNVRNDNRDTNINGQAQKTEVINIDEKEYINPANIEFPGLITITDDKGNGKKFMSFADMVRVTPVITKSNVDFMKATHKGDTYVEIRNTVAKADTPSTAIKFSVEGLDTDTYEYVLVALGSVASEDDGTISPDCLVDIFVGSAIFGATDVVPLSEGITKRLASSSVGIGLNFGSATESTMTTGGTGWSKGWSGHVKDPFHTFAAYKRTINKKEVKEKAAKIKAAKAERLVYLTGILDKIINAGS